MSNTIKQLTCVALAAAFVMIASSTTANAQYPVVNTVTPAVVGYSAEPAGLFGLRTRYRPVVAPVTTPVAVAPVAVAPVPVTPITVAPTVVRSVPVTTTTVVQPRRVVTYSAPPTVHTYYTPTPVVSPVTYVAY